MRSTWSAWTAAQLLKQASARNRDPALMNLFPTPNYEESSGTAWLNRSKS